MINFFPYLALNYSLYTVFNLNGSLSISLLIELFVKNFRNAVLSSDAKRPKSSAFKKKLKDQTRPYTPIYSTLLNKEETISIDRQSIIRQLCVLLWIMESVSLEKASAPPLNNCFNLKYIYLTLICVR